MLKRALVFALIGVYLREEQKNNLPKSVTGAKEIPFWSVVLFALVKKHIDLVY